MPDALYDPIQLVVYTLALASLTRLVTGTDKLTAIPVAWIVMKIDDARCSLEDALDDTRWSSGWVTARVLGFPLWFISSMISCVWCAPFWLALGVVLPVMIGYGHVTAVYYIALGLAMRFIAGLLNAVR